jgi:hypothetical protein
MIKKTILFLILMTTSISHSTDTMTLKTTLDRLLNETTRGRIIAGEREVAEDKFTAEKIGYYIP